MLKNLRIAAVLLVLLSIMTGVVYPIVVTGVARLVFPTQSEGSLVVRDGLIVGSRLIGQAFSDGRYFRGRPSATPDGAYNAAASSASNLGPTSRQFIDLAASRASSLRKVDGLARDTLLPGDSVTASGSGLDPDISPANAYLQVPRIAKSRHMSQSLIRSLVTRNITRRQFRLLGVERINVLLLNLELDILATRY